MRGGQRGARPTDDLRRPLRRNPASRLRRAAWITATLLAVCLISSFFLLRWLEIGRLERDLAAIHEEQRVALAHQEALRADLALKDDPEAIEARAREELGLVKPGEEKVIFVEVDEEED